MELLESRNLIHIIWKDNKRDYLIQKVRLVTDHIEEAYKYVGRKPKLGLEEENITLLQKYIDVAAPITVNFVKHLMERLQKHQSVQEYITLENKKETEQFLRACVLVEQNSKPCYIREFSIRHFQDSKYFEHIEAVLLKYSGNFRMAVWKRMPRKYWQNTEFTVLLTMCILKEMQAFQSAKRR